MTLDDGVPGSVGGVLRVSAGGETRERVVDVHAVDRKGDRHVLSKADIGYSYLRSGASNDMIFSHAVTADYSEDKATIRADRDAAAV